MNDIIQRLFFCTSLAFIGCSSEEGLTETPQEKVSITDDISTDPQTTEGSTVEAEIIDEPEENVVTPPQPPQEEANPSENILDVQDSIEYAVIQQRDDEPAAYNPPSTPETTDATIDDNQVDDAIENDNQADDAIEDDNQADDAIENDNQADDAIEDDNQADD
ncbi:MAG: hypothetical protein ABJH06_12360, partial [Paraglaciecola sp.]|uniref:hypothetical protein n=1 Tax=Paraglaciecola sp. TaxID=1920173 RepID=UPI0032986012